MDKAAKEADKDIEKAAKEADKEVEKAGKEAEKDVDQANKEIQQDVEAKGEPTEVRSQFSTLTHAPSHPPTPNISLCFIHTNMCT